MRNDDKVAGDEKVAGDLKTRMDKIKATYENEQKDWPTGPATDYIISWETFFMKIALTSKERSTHPEYKVKTIINSCYCIISPITGWSMCSITI